MDNEEKLEILLKDIKNNSSRLSRLISKEKIYVFLEEKDNFEGNLVLRYNSSNFLDRIARFFDGIFMPFYLGVGPNYIRKERNTYSFEVILPSELQVKSSKNYLE